MDVAADSAPRRDGDRGPEAEGKPTATDWLEYAVLRTAVGFFGLLPRGCALRAGAFLGELFYVLHRRGRAIGLRNLAIAFPNRGPAEHRAILRASARNLGRLGAEICHLPALTPETVRRFVAPADSAAWHAALDRAARTGGVILTAHLGNWELLAYVHGLLGYPITLVHRPMRNALVDAYITQMRAAAGTVSLSKKNAAKAALYALRRRQLLAIPADQNQTRRYGVFVDFFGLPACTTAGPSRMAMLSGTPLLPVFLVRDGESDQHRILVLPDIELVHTGDREADVLTNTQRCTAVIEDMLRRYPEQWIWFHKRWNTRPRGEPRVYPVRRSNAKSPGILP
ncbi:MAG: lysophospholipid acyltransferase family protein [Candidatus Binatia bacterium]